MINGRINHFIVEIKTYIYNSKTYFFYLKSAFNILVNRIKMNLALISTQRVMNFITGEDLKISIRQENESDYVNILDTDATAYGLEYEGVLYKHLRNKPKFDKELSIIASTDEKIIGHILFYPIESENNKSILKTALLVVASVRPEFQNKGVGTRLIAQGIHILKSKGFNSVIVLGYPEYYTRFGFEPASKWSIKTVNKMPEETLLAMELKPGALQNLKEIINFPECVWGV